MSRHYITGADLVVGTSYGMKVRVDGNYVDYYLGKLTQKAKSGSRYGHEDSGSQFFNSFKFENVLPRNTDTSSLHNADVFFEMQVTNKRKRSGSRSRSRSNSSGGTRRTRRTSGTRGRRRR
jgi:hypothetical protein